MKMIFFPVLRDVVRVERRDAQADRDLQETRRHHQTSSPIPLRRGKTKIILPSNTRAKCWKYFLNLSIGSIVMQT